VTESEDWKICPVYPHLEISSYGRVRTIDRMVTNKLGVSRLVKGQPLKIRINKKIGRAYVSFFLKNKMHYKSVHRLVGLTFVPNPHGKPEINHIDGVKLNNHYKNLEWVTRQENIDHSIALGLQKTQTNRDRHPLSKIKNKDLDDLFELIKHKSMRYAARHYGVSYACVWRIQKKWRWKYGENDAKS
jgi:hypothetical protein